MRRGHTWHPAFSIRSLRNRTVGSAHRIDMIARGQHTEEPGAGGRGGAGRVLLSAERMPSTHSSCGMARREARFGSEDSAPTRTPAAEPLPLPPFPSAIFCPRAPPLRRRLRRGV